MDNLRYKATQRAILRLLIKRRDNGQTNFLAPWGKEPSKALVRMCDRVGVRLQIWIR